MSDFLVELRDQAENGDPKAMLELGCECLSGLRTFLTSVGDVDLLTNDKEQEVLQRIGEGDERALMELVDANLRLALSVAKLHLGQSHLFTKLYGWGAVGLVIAAVRYEPASGIAFSTYAAFWVRAVIVEALLSFRFGRPLEFPDDAEELIRRVDEDFQRQGFVLSVGSPAELARAFSEMTERSEPLGLLRDGFGQPAERRQEGLAWLERAADCGYPPALKQLATQAEDDGDFETAIAWLQRGAELDDTACMVRLATLLDQRGDTESASCWFEQAASRGSHRAMYALGTSPGLAGGDSEAGQWLQAAIDAGFPQAFVAKAMLHVGEERFAEARSLLAVAAAAGESHAFTRLGEIAWLQGDEAIGRAWLELAARRNDAEALCFLATEVADSDPVEAIERLRLAAAHGSKKALALLSGSTAEIGDA